MFLVDRFTRSLPSSTRDLVDIGYGVQLDVRKQQVFGDSHIWISLWFVTDVERTKRRIALAMPDGSKPVFSKSCLRFAANSMMAVEFYLTTPSKLDDVANLSAEALAAVSYFR